MAGDLLRPGPGGRYADAGTTSGTAFDRDGNIHGGMGTDWGDYDNDGKLDLFVCTFQGESKSLYRSQGGGLFGDASYRAGLALPTMPRVAFGCKFLDYDNDGWLDLVTANGHVQDNIHAIDTSATYRQTLQIFHNEKGGAFRDVTASAGAAFALPSWGGVLRRGTSTTTGAWTFWRWTRRVHLCFCTTRAGAGTTGCRCG